MAMEKKGRLSESDFRKMDDNDPRKKRWQQVNKKYGEQGRFHDKKKNMEAARGRAGGSSADTTNKAARAKQLASDYSASQQDKSQGVQDRRQALSSRSSERSYDRKSAQDIRQERRDQISHSQKYSLPQKERDQQDRNRGAQRLGAVSEGAQSLNRRRARIERPTLSETTEVETELHSGNRSNIPSRIENRRMRAENIKNRRDHTYRSEAKERDNSGLRSDADRRAMLSRKNDRGEKFVKDFTSRYER